MCLLKVSTTKPIGINVISISLQLSLKKKELFLTKTELYDFQRECFSL